MPSIIAILGPSGVGKSCVCNSLVTNDSFLHMEFDGHRPWESNGFPSDWDQNVHRVDFSLVALRVRSRIEGRQHPAAVLSFATIHVFTTEQLAQAVAEGIVPIILWGSEEQCIAARAERSKKNRIRFNEADRVKYRNKNRPALEVFGGQAYSRHRVDAFQSDGTRWPADHLPNVCKATDDHANPRM